MFRKSLEDRVAKLENRIKDDDGLDDQIMNLWQHLEGMARLFGIEFKRQPAATIAHFKKTGDKKEKGK